METIFTNCCPIFQLLQVCLLLPRWLIRQSTMSHCPGSRQRETEEAPSRATSSRSRMRVRQSGWASMIARTCTPPLSSPCPTSVNSNATTSGLSQSTTLASPTPAPAPAKFWLRKSSVSHFLKSHSNNQLSSLIKISQSITDVFIDISPPTVPPSITINVQADDLLCIRAGDPIRIPATIKGRPVPKVTWDFYGKAKSHKKNKLHTLPVDSEVRETMFLLIFLFDFNHPHPENSPDEKKWSRINMSINSNELF